MGTLKIVRQHSSSLTYNLYIFHNAVITKHIRLKFFP